MFFGAAHFDTKKTAAKSSKWTMFSNIIPVGLTDVVWWKPTSTCGVFSWASDEIAKTQGRFEFGGRVRWKLSERPGPWNFLEKRIKDPVVWRFRTPSRDDSQQSAGSPIFTVHLGMPGEARSYSWQVQHLVLVLMDLAQFTPMKCVAKNGGNARSRAKEFRLGEAFFWLEK